jgi:CheY-like chemotaxis protein/anti-sigma regulatory factor (Ser/Thr protein kinase)
VVRILVVDDSAADRELAGHLLAKKSWTVFYAEDGRQALDRMREHEVDLVLTDLVMPDLDGLAFVEQAKIDHPLVPVVLMTARGSEEIAVQALEAGASSYVPKKALVRDLVEVVQRILDASREHKSYTRLLGRLQAASFTLENDLELISSLVSYLTQVLRDSGMFGESDCHGITTALDEALTNAYYHGNLEVRSEIREHDARAYRALVEERRQTAPYRDRRIRVSANLTPGEARFVIADEGRGFDVGAVPDPTAPENLARPSGRGIFLMKTFLDDVRYNEAGNEVTLLKRRPG